MDFIQADNIDNLILICGKSEANFNYIELLYENKKRTGGDDIKNIYYDKVLKQYLVVFASQETATNVLNFGPICYSGESYIPMRVDRDRFILSNIDERLEKDVLYLFADHLLQDIDGLECKIDTIKPGFVLVTCNKNYDPVKLKDRLRKRGKLQRRDISVHLVAKLDNENGIDFKEDNYSNFYVNLLKPNEEEPSSPRAPNKSSNLLRCSKTSKPCNERITLIQDTDDEPVSNQIGNSTLCTTNDTSCYHLQERIKFLERKLKIYENLNENLEKINRLSDCFLKFTSETPSNSVPLFNRYSTVNQVNNPPAQNSISSLLAKATEDINRLSIADNPTDARPPFNFSRTDSNSQSNIISSNTDDVENRSNLLEVRNNIHKFLLEEHKKFEQLQRDQPPSQLLNNTPNQESNHPVINFQPKQAVRNRLPQFNPSRVNQVQHRPTTSINFGRPRPNPLVNLWPNENTSRVSIFGRAPNSAALDQSLINRFPIIKYKKPKQQSPVQSIESELDTGENSNLDTTEGAAESAGNPMTCSICLEELIENEDVRLLSCFHQFHVKCIDTWLKEKSTCPSCKFNLATTFNYN